MKITLGISLLIFALVTLVGSPLAVSRIGKPLTNFEGKQAGVIILYCTLEVIVLLLSAKELLA